MMVPDRNGELADVLLGYDDAEGYLVNGPHFGSIVGRIANRTGGASFTLNGTSYVLGKNKGENNLHSGPDYYDRRLWAAREAGEDSVVFLLDSPDGDQGYPGDLNAEVVYDWSDDCELEITYYAKTTAPTIINLTNHSYFNLKGEDRPGAMDQLLQINGSKYLRYDADCVCTGELVDVKGTPMDFSEPKALSAEIDADYEPLRFGSGYDQSWAIDGYEKGKLSEAGVLYDPQSGRRMRIRTTQPSIHIYAGNYLEGCPQSISGHPYGRRAGVAIECQAYPNSPNCPGFPSTVLRPGEIYNEKIVFRFETDAN